MLILIVGITGNIGLKLASALIKRGHRVSGTSRSIATLPDNVRGKLEGLFETKSWYDAETLRKAMKGVDAVVCAYSPIPALALEAELLLVRIMEEEGIKVKSLLVHLEYPIADIDDPAIYTVHLESRLVPAAMGRRAILRFVPRATETTRLIVYC